MYMYLLPASPWPGNPLGVGRVGRQAGVAIEQVNQFKRAWMRHAYRYTREYTSIYAGQLVDFLKELPPPLGVGVEGSYYDCQVLAKKVRTSPRSPKERIGLVLCSPADNELLCT